MRGVERAKARAGKKEEKKASGASRAVREYTLTSSSSIEFSPKTISV